MDKHRKEHRTGGDRLEQKAKYYTVKKYPRKPRLTWQQKVLAAIAVLLAIALIAVLAWKSLFVRPDVEKKPQSDQPQSSTSNEVIDYGGVSPKAEGERKSKDFYSVLILGRDTGGGGNTDTMLLASYDVTNQKAAVMSIPRDTMVNVDWDVKKINSVYNMYGGGDRGLKALYREVAQLVGFEPDFEVIVEWEAVGKLVDAIGGVYFDVPYQMDYHDKYQNLSIEQDKGYRLLNGDDAMQVIRWRQNDKNSPYGNPNVGDSGRMTIQQDFLKAIIKQMMTPANVKNIGKIARVFEESVQTDMSLQNILWFGQQAFTGGLNLEDVSFFTMPYKAAWAWSRSYQQNLSYVVPKPDELLKIVNEQLSPFAEVFALSDLDIMFANADGSVGSTTGHVEDAVSALPPEKPKEEEPQTPETPQVDITVDPETGLPVVEGEIDGITVDPETGIITVPGFGELIVDPETGELRFLENGGNGGEEDPQDPPQVNDPGEDDPSVPQEGDEGLAEGDDPQPPQEGAEQPEKGDDESGAESGETGEEEPQIPAEPDQSEEPEEPAEPQTP